MKYFSAFITLLSFAASTHAQFGVLDPSFGGDGIVQTMIGNASIAQAVAVQPDGKILVGGNSDSTAVVVRYLADGSLDAAFGTGGVVTLDVQEIAAIGDVLVQSDGKILVCGRAATAPYSDLMLGRFHPDGSLDTSFGFGGNGLVYVAAPPNLMAGVEMAIQPDNKILLAGWVYSAPYSVRMMRFTANGLTDSGTFGTGGGTSVFTVPGATVLDVRGMALQPDGRILFCGTITAGTNTNRYVARMLSDGSIDTGFGSGGTKIFDAGALATERGSDVLVQDDTRILLVAFVGTDTGDEHVQVTRLFSDGSVDTGYGTGGDAVGGDMNGTVFTQQGILQTDGKVVFGGHYNAGVLYHALWRVNTDGTFDSTFGTAGQVLQPFGTGNSLLFDVAEEADGKLVVTGQVVADEQFTTARLTTGQPAGIVEGIAESALVITPNPNDGRFFLHTGNNQLDRVDITGAEGRLVLSLGHVQGDIAIDVSEQPSGAYMVRAIAAGKVTTLSFIKH